MEITFRHLKHAHICGDSTKAEDYQTLMGDERAQLIYADPPYCLLTRRNKKTGQKRDLKTAKINHEAVKRYENVKEYRKFTKEWMGAALKCLEENGVFIIWTNFLGKKPIMDCAKDLGLDHFYGEFIWGKLTREKNSNESNARVYEVALVFSRVPMKDRSLNEPARQWSVITHYDEEGEASDWGDHPNHKPLSCLAPLILEFSKPGDIILDPFTGSGSTPAAVIKLDRCIRGIELRPHWAEMTQKRIRHHLNVL